MKPGYKKKVTSSKKKLSKQKRKEAKQVEAISNTNGSAEPEAMDVDEALIAKPSSRREKKKREVLAVKKQKLKVDMLKKTTIKGRKKAARGVQGCTNLAVSTLGAQELQQAQKGQLAASLTAVGIDVDMRAV